MVFKDCKFDPVRDIAPVDQFGFIDLKSALADSVVPSQMPGAETDYNGIDDPNQVLGKPHDIFEALDTQKALEDAASSSSSSSSSSGDDDKSV